MLENHKFQRLELKIYRVVVRDPITSRITGQSNGRAGLVSQVCAPAPACPAKIQEFLYARGDGFIGLLLLMFLARKYLLLALLTWTLKEFA